MSQENTVELLDYAGGDKSHAQAAWASTSTEVTPDRLERIPALLEMLAQNGHGTPFEHSMLMFRLETDLATHVHFLKHRIGVSINSESARYKELMRGNFYLPEDWPEGLREEMRTHVETSLELYHSLIRRLEEEGVPRKRAKESARLVLPYSHQIRYVVTCNFRSFIHFQRLRSAPDAQLEVREIAEQMLELVRSTNDFYYSLQAHGF